MRLILWPLLVVVASPILEFWCSDVLDWTQTTTPKAKSKFDFEFDVLFHFVKTYSYCAYNVLANTLSFILSCFDRHALWQAACCYFCGCRHPLQDAKHEDVHWPVPKCVHKKPPSEIRGIVVHRFRFFHGLVEIKTKN